MLKINKTLSKSLYILYITALICDAVPLTVSLTYHPVSAISHPALSDISTMQEITPEICTNSARYESQTLRDVRDGNNYTVMRLDDGNCWMTSSLRLTSESLTANGQSATLSSDTSNISADNTFTLPASITELPTEAPEAFTDAVDYNNLAQIYYSTDNNASAAYYNWYAATAGAGNAEVINEEVGSDICPKGWQLPNRSIFQTLLTYADEYDETNRGYTLGGAIFPLSGYIQQVFSASNNYGYFWSNTSYNSASSYRLYLRNPSAPSSNIPTTTTVAAVNRYRGIPIRCVAPSNNTDFPTDISIQNTNVAVTVTPNLTIDAIGGMEVEVVPQTVSEKTIFATVSANTSYSVQLSALETSLVNPNDPTGPNIPASSDVKPNTSAWGIKTDSDTFLPITNNPTTYYNESVFDEATQSTTHAFGVGVSISPSLPAGRYSTTVTITAVNN